MKLALGVFGLIMALILGAIAGGITVLSRGLPEVMALEDFRPPSSTTIYAADSTLLTEFAVERRTPVPIGEMPQNLINAVISIEDHRYFEHIGINVMRIAKALAVDVLSGEAKEGGSTITQQLAKVLFLTPKKTIKRKVREAILAFEIEKLYTKEEILALYLNQIPFGNGTYGVAAASQGYFGKEVSELNLAECALLAALPKAPSRYNPFRNPDLAKDRRDLVIRRMLALGWVTEGDASAAFNIPVPVKGEERAPQLAPYFVEEVRKELVEVFGWEAVYRGGLKVYTTLDPVLQRTAEEALSKQVKLVEGRHNFKVKPDPVQGALIALDPRSGAVLAHIGGTDWKESQFDRVTQARRQMGSTFKPFIYGTAIEEGMTQATTILDSPVSYPGSSPKEPWKPQNYERDFEGKITLRKALAHSRNIPAIKLLKEIGLPKVEAFVRRLGLEDAMGEGLATALGVGGATLESLTAAYATLPAGGMRPTPYRIRAVFGPEGKNLWEAPQAPMRVMEPKDAFILADMLRAVVEEGTGKQARSLPFKVAGKTGTTDDQRDASFLGFSSQVALGVWVGRDDNSTLGLGETGARAALPLWVDVMFASALDGTPPPWLAPPKVEFARIDLISGKLAGELCDKSAFAAFALSTAPDEICTREEFGWSRFVSSYTFDKNDGDTF
ncbi:MAG: penicillin-binding protein [Deltaproteobacteria bacterium]|nr:MAG: penicillin-binding protein [Deltaproteobacteria bacterium]